MSRWGKNDRKRVKTRTVSSGNSMIAPPNYLGLRDQNMQAHEFLQWSGIVLDSEFIINYKTQTQSPSLPLCPFKHS